MSGFHARAATCSVALTLLLAVDATAQSRPAGVVPLTDATTHCVALPLPAVRGADADGGELGASIRELTTSYLTGPGMRPLPLEARLPQLALDEALRQDCGVVLLTTWTRTRSGGGGGVGRALGEVAGTAAWHAPTGGSLAGGVARGAAIAGAGAITTAASGTRARDQWRLEYRLATEGDRTLLAGHEALKASEDGEDLLSPLVERMAAAVVRILTR